VKILGIPIKLEPSFFIVAFILGAGRARDVSLVIEWLVVVLISVLLHELGHALVARAFQLNPSIALYGMGGLTSWQQEVEVSPFKRLLITLAGPFAGFAFGLIIFIVGPINPQSPLFVSAYYDLLWVNVGWGIFNLLPMLPLDGGNVMVSVESWIARRESRIVSHAISLIISIGILCLALYYGLLWIGILGAWFAYSNGSVLIGGTKSLLDRKHEEDLRLANEALEKNEFDRALELGRRVQSAARTTPMQSSAASIVIFALIFLSRFREADEEITKFYGLFGEAPYLSGIFHFRQDQFADAIPHLRKAFAQTPDKNIGLMLAKSLSSEKKFAEVLELINNPVLKEVNFELAVNLQNEAFNANDFQVAGEAGARAYEIRRDGSTAYNNACAYARAGEITKGLYWLELAVDAGFNDREMLTNDPDIEPLRSASGFASILAKVAR
jgi:Zn-dependent protease